MIKERHGKIVWQQFPVAVAYLKAHSFTFTNFKHAGNSLSADVLVICRIINSVNMLFLVLSEKQVGTVSI